MYIDGQIKQITALPARFVNAIAAFKPVRLRLTRGNDFEAELAGIRDLIGIKYCSGIAADRALNNLGGFAVDGKRC